MRWWADLKVGVGGTAFLFLLTMHRVPFLSIAFLMIVVIDSPSLLWYLFARPKRLFTILFVTLFFLIRDDSFCIEPRELAHYLDGDIFTRFQLTIDKETVWSGEPVIFW